MFSRTLNCWMRLYDWNTKTKPRAAHCGKRIIVHARDVFPAEQVTPRARAVQATEKIQQGGLAAPGRAHDANVISGFNCEADAAQRLLPSPAPSGRSSARFQIGRWEVGHNFRNMSGSRVLA